MPQSASSRVEIVRAKPQLPNVRIIMSGGMPSCVTRVVRAAGCRIRILHTPHDSPLQLLGPFAPPCVGDRALHGSSTVHRKENAMKPSDVLASRIRSVRLDIYGEHGGPL
jgi:hypothetical protein